MGETPEEIAQEIEQTREELGAKVDLLAGQVGRGVEAAKKTGTKAGMIVLGVAAALLLIKTLRRR